MSEWKNGLPPVGEECEYQFNNFGWKKCKPIWIGTGLCVLETPNAEEDCYDLMRTQFRPIKSEAERKRDEQIEWIYQTLNFAGDWYRNPKTVAGHLHKAGCRKVNPLTDEQISAKFPDCRTFQDIAKWARSQIMGED